MCLGQAIQLVFTEWMNEWMNEQIGDYKLGYYIHISKRKESVEVE